MNLDRAKKQVKATKEQAAELLDTAITRAALSGYRSPEIPQQFVELVVNAAVLQVAISQSEESIAATRPAVEKEQEHDRTA